MKQLLLTITLFLFCIQFSTAQKTQKIAYVSPKKDTLMLPNNELGMLILDTWYCNPIVPQPVIILTDEDTIKVMNVLYENRKKKRIKI